MFENYLSVFSVFCHKHKIVLITLVSEIIDLYSKIMFFTHWTWLQTFVKLRHGTKPSMILHVTQSK